ncbi:uncharacterized protein MELLADRAFT_94412 [Melampsora larici-populina 98AG31]|uniref:CxC1-like cysteine cluster associated with KDZ transposases domain-containing protein n=1 Tax=Melampsora larici-populina (strain 98AG31 / pathotype 3-4-7) TaxID=747676 RepID=F4RBF2_MELLP|nr:uncharacterized protein MELLADRAFT_94412 [Melampsora larici-populina 98AG31]EGG10072.1 hypothetical protein MELLADRAFT_94412 [Melampsora larici-populina 98AG31]
MITGIKSRPRRTQATTRPAPFTSQRAKDLAAALGHIRKTSGGQQPPIEANNPDNDQRLAKFMPMDYHPDALPSSPLEPTALDLFAQQCQGWQHAEKQKQSQAIWDGLEASMTAAYLYCQNGSTNWTRPDTLDISCACTRSEQSTQPVDLIDVLGTETANDVRNSTSWDRCDDTGLFACACCHNVPLQFVNIFRSGEKLHYPVAILDKLLTELPEKKLGVLYDIGCHLQVHVNKRNLLSQHKGRLLYGTSVFHAYAHQWWCQIFFNPRFIKFFGLSDGEGLERQIISVKEPLREASSRALTELEGFINPDYPERWYTAEFFHAQWVLEREAHSVKKVTEHEMQLELACLLCLEEELGNFWQTVGNQLAPAQALVRLQTQQKLEKSIEEQRAKIGRSNLVGLTGEKRPLEDSRVPGKKSKLGTHGKTALLASLRKHAAKLFQACKIYNTRCSEYRQCFPDQPFCPAPIVYNDLHKMGADNVFWSDGLFTNATEPWATDPHTQRGMRQQCYFERANEEIRRIGWEVRRSMRWATSCYEIAVKTLFYNSFLVHTHLMELWDKDVLKAFLQTPHQLNDNTVLSSWKRQLQDIRTLRKNGLLSRVLGDWNAFYQNYVEQEMEDIEDIPDLIEDDGTTENESTDYEEDEYDEEDQWIKTLDDEV